MTREEFAERYKVIDIEKQGNILTVKLYISEIEMIKHISFV